MIRSTAFALLLTSAWLAMPGQSFAAPPATTAQWTFAMSSTDHTVKHRHHYYRHVVRHPAGGGLPTSVARVIRSERTLGNPNNIDASQKHGPQTRAECDKMRNRNCRPD